MADAKRQLVLNTFAMTGGDHERTSKVLGLDLGDVRAELASLLNRNGETALTGDRAGVSRSGASGLARGRPSKTKVAGKVKVADRSKGKPRGRR